MEFPFSKGTRPKKSRSGSIPLNVETLARQKRYEKAKISEEVFDSFLTTMMGKWSAGDYNPTYPAPMSGTHSGAGIQLGPKTPPEDTVTDEAAREAIRQLKQRKNLRRHAGIAALGTAASPFIAAAGRGAKGFVDTKGTVKKRLGGAAKGVGSASAGEVASQAITGGLGGAASSIGAEGIRFRQADQKLRKFLQQEKTSDGMTGMGGTSGSMVGGAPAATMGSLPSGGAKMPNAARGVGDFTPARPKKPGHTIRKQSINPRLRLLDAMNKSVA